MTALRFTVPGKPVAKGRPRFARVGKGVRAFTPPATARFEERVRLAAVNAGVTPAAGPVAVRIHAYWTWSTSEQRKTTPRPEAWRVRKPDLENVVKGVLDALNGVAYHDDAQVTKLEAEKRQARQGDAARTEVDVWQLLGEAS